MRQAAVLFAGLSLLFPLAAYAEPISVPTQRGFSPFAAQAMFEKVLKPTPQHPLQVSPLEDDVTALPTHVKLTYRSALPVPVLIGPLGALPHDMLAAVLPASPTDAQEVYLDLRNSPDWRPGKHGVSLNIYWVDGHEPELIDVSPMQQGGIGRSLVAVGGHLFRSEGFGSFSPNFLLGYKVAGMPFSVLLFVLGVVGCALMVRRRGVVSAASVAALAVIAVWQVRFVPDVVGMTVHEQSAWRDGQDAGELGHVAAIAQFVQQMDLPAEQAITVCTQQATPFRYFLSPRAVVTDASVLAKGGIAVLDQQWDDATTLHCKDVVGTGKVLTRYPNGDALVQFSPKP